MSRVDSAATVDRSCRFILRRGLLTCLCRQEHRRAKTQETEQSDRYERQSQRPVPRLCVDADDFIDYRLGVPIKRLLYLGVAHGADALLDGGIQLLLLPTVEHRAVADASGESRNER